MSQTERLTALAHGRVQGVFFRAFAARHARDLGLSGYVRNLPDGTTVEVMAEGNRQQLEKFLQALGQGPPGAWVDQVEAYWDKATGAFRSFEIRY